MSLSGSSQTVTRRTIVWGSSPRGTQRESTILHVDRGWLPVNPRVLKKLRDGIDTGELVEDRTSLIDMLKQDLALCSALFRRLPSAAHEAANSPSPLQRIRDLDPEDLKALTGVVPLQVSRHLFRDFSRNQSLQLQRTIAGTAAAESIAAWSGADEDDAYIAVLLKDIGMNLIAWNYPVLFSRALAYQRTRRSTLDVELIRSLGLTPVELGEKFAQRLNVPLRIRNAVQDAAIASASRVQREGALSLSEICQFASCFAESKDPANFREGAERWEEKREELISRTGSNRLNELEESVAERLEAYRETILPKDRIQVQAPDSRTGSDSAGAASLAQRNACAHRCPPVLRDQFCRLYDDFAFEELEIGAIERIANEILPVAGFARGCLFLLDNKASLLVPKLRFGDRALASYAPVPITRDEAIAQAVYSSIPAEEIVVENDEEVSVFSSGFENTRVEGVLYLEASAERTEETRRGSIIAFRAVRDALIDALAIRLKDTDML